VSTSDATCYQYEVLLTLHRHFLSSSVSHASIAVLEHILCADHCDVDITNGNVLDRDTPLHLAVKLDEDGRKGLRAYVGESMRDVQRRPGSKRKREREKEGRVEGSWLGRLCPRRRETSEPFPMLKDQVLFSFVSARRLGSIQLRKASVSMHCATPNGLD
jgi:hypothetical protein